MSKTDKTAAAIAAIWVLAVTLALALAFGPAARAAPLPLPTEIPSAASARYSTPAGECSVVFSRFGADHVNVDITCPGTFSHSTAFAFNGACIGQRGTANVFPLDGQNLGLPWIAFDAFDGTNLIVRRGANANVLYAGGGVGEYWSRIEALPSPQPYTCSAPPALSRFRVFGR